MTAPLLATLALEFPFSPLGATWAACTANCAANDLLVGLSAGFDPMVDLRPGSFRKVRKRFGSPPATAAADAAVAAAAAANLLLCSASLLAAPGC